MKGSCTLVASMLAASTVALSSSSSSSSSDVASFPGYTEGAAASIRKNGASSIHASSGQEKFAPRFDGLRFIETLVTAHR